MQAITCSQCGALIERVRINDKLAECVYCHATIPIEKEKVFDVVETKKPLEKKNTPYEDYLKRKAQYKTEPSEPEGSVIVNAIIVFGGIGVFVVLLAILFLNSLFTSPQKEIFASRETTNESTKDSDSKPADIEIPTPQPTVIPEINYRAYVKYNTSLGAEHIEIPTIEADQLTTFDIDELKKTVFKQKRIKVQITINPDGEVIAANALNGHKVLRESSVRAAKKSLFTTRKRETKTTLIYIFVLEV